MQRCRAATGITRNTFIRAYSARAISIRLPATGESRPQRVLRLHAGTWRHRRDGNGAVEELPRGLRQYPARHRSGAQRRGLRPFDDDVSGRTIFIADTTINERPTGEQLAGSRANVEARTMGYERRSRSCLMPITAIRPAHWRRRSARPSLFWTTRLRISNTTARCHQTSRSI